MLMPFFSVLSLTAQLENAMKAKCRTFFFVQCLTDILNELFSVPVGSFLVFPRGFIHARNLEPHFVKVAVAEQAF